MAQISSVRSKPRTVSSITNPPESKQFDFYN